jgi:8-oxo-dGTP pyrophosphatase MutT (NUDIX family)
MERTLISERFALAAAPGRRSTLDAAISGSVVAVPREGQQREGQQARRGDHDLNPDMLPTRALVPAAVLVGLVERPDGMSVLFTKRTAHLTDHAGQISFPGGRVDATDADVVAAALREAEEEVGLPRHHVEMIGRLDTYVTRTGFEITPCVGFVKPPELYRADPFEVAEVFEVPLRFFRDPRSRKLESRLYQSRQRFFYAYPWGEYYIWGATAGMLNNLIEILGHLDET